MTQIPFRILIVDDAEMARAHLRQLSTKGFEIIAEAINTKEALTCLEKNDIDTVIVDYDLRNGFNGLQLAKKIRKYYPSKKIFLFSDHLRQGDKEENILIYDGVMPKYYSVQQIANFLRYVPQNSSNKFSDKELTLLKYLAEGKPNESIAIIEWENNVIEGFLKKFHAEYLINAYHQNKNPSNIERILYYFCMHGLDVKYIKGSRFTSTNTWKNKEEEAELYRKAIRSSLCGQSLNIKYSLIQSEIPKIWDRLIEQLDDWVDHQLTNDITAQTTNNIDLLIEQFFEEKQDHVRTHICFADGKHNAQLFTSKVREAGYLHRSELSALYQELRNEIDRVYDKETKRLRNQIKENYLIERYFIETKRLSMGNSRGKSYATIEREKVRYDQYTYPSQNGNKLHDELTLWISDKLPELDMLMSEIGKYFRANNAHRALQKEKKKLLETCLHTIKHSQNASEEIYELYSAYVEPNVYQQKLKQVNAQCSKLIKKINSFESDNNPNHNSELHSESNLTRPSHPIMSHADLILYARSYFACL